jgi:hypothetical protein
MYVNRSLLLALSMSGVILADPAGTPAKSTKTAPA